MGNKQNVKQKNFKAMLKYFKAFAMLAIIALGVLTVSCQKEDLTSTGKVETFTLNGTADSTINDPTVLQSRNWNFRSYSSTVSQNYNLYSAIQLSEKKYRFVVISNSSNSNEELYVKTYCHTDGLDNYKKLQRINPYSTPKMYMVDSIFDRSALYSYKYFVREDPSTNNLRPLSTGTSPTFTTLVVPDTTDDYDANVIVSNYQSGPSDQWYFYPYNCTSWAALKVNQMWGTSTTFNNRMFGNGYHLHDALNWKQVFVSKGYSVTTTPQKGDIIWFPADVTYNNITYSGNNGHVGFVHSVENGVIEYSNYDGSTGSYRLSQLSTSIISNVQAEFIHVQYKH